MFTDVLSLSSWLANLDLAAYVDNFHQQGYHNMFELQEFSLEVSLSMWCFIQSPTDVFLMYLNWL